MTIMFSALATVSQSWGASEGDVNNGVSQYPDVATCTQSLLTQILPALTESKPISVPDITEEERARYGENQLMIFGSRHVFPHVQSPRTAQDNCFLRITADSLFGGAPGIAGLTEQSIAASLLSLEAHDYRNILINVMNSNAGEAEYDAYGIFMVERQLWPLGWLSQEATRRYLQLHPQDDDNAI